MCPNIFQNHSTQDFTNTPRLKREFYVTCLYAEAGISRYRLVNVAPNVRGEICGSSGESQLSQQTSCAREGMHCGIVFVTCLGCHVSTSVAYRASHNYHSRCCKIETILSRMHARNASRRRRTLRPRETRRGTSLPEIEEPFHTQKTAKNLIEDALRNRCFPFSVFSVMFSSLSKKSLFGGYQTDRWTNERTREFLTPKQGSSARQTSKTYVAQS